jgi:diguanylate cyclase
VGRRRALTRPRITAEAIELAQTDPLTDLPNRRAWTELLEREVARVRRFGKPLCVAMVDLDHFKRFNDTHGHVAGDELLRQVARAWSDVIRPTDTMARYGGEEFAVLLPDCGLGDAIVVIERLRRATPGGERCSAGVACWDERETPVELVARADARLYEAKAQGRDRVVPADLEAVFRS